MPLFSRPVPIPPQPRGRSAVRENDSLAALVETRSVVQKIDSFLRQFSIKQVNSADGRILNVLGSDVGFEEVGTSESAPFQIQTKNAGTSEDPVWKAGVTSGSLFLSPKWDDRKTISGLLNDDLTVGWNDLLANDAFWLELVWTGITLSASIKSFGASGEWSDFADMVEFASSSSPAQTKAKFPIGYSIADSEGNPSITQSLHSNLLLTNACFAGKACLYPRPFDLEPYIT